MNQAAIRAVYLLLRRLMNFNNFICFILRAMLQPAKFPLALANSVLHTQVAERWQKGDKGQLRLGKGA
jgi:hypothetical protein